MALSVSKLEKCFLKKFINKKNIYKLFSGFKNVGAIIDENIKLCTKISRLRGKMSKNWTVTFEPSMWEI